MQYLRTNTAVIVAVGPFLDKTDGVTLETALTITNERISLVAETDAGSAPTIVLDNVTGATSGTSNDLNYITGQDNAMMQLELAAADVNRLGRMRLTITDAANHCPVFHDYFLLPQDIYDAMAVAGSGYGDILNRTTIATLASQTSFTLTGGSADNSAYVGATLICTDQTTAAQKCVGIISAYTGSTKTITLAADPGVFTMATGDLITILAESKALPAQLFGVAGGLPTFSQVDTIDNFVDTEIAGIVTTLGTPAGASMSADIAAIEAQTDDIGVAGAGLTALASQASVDTIDNFLDTEVAAILALLDDPRTEPGQGAPPVNPDLATKIDYLYKAWRNKKTQTATLLTVFADDGTTADHKSTVSDDGTTFTAGEIVTGA